MINIKTAIRKGKVMHKPSKIIQDLFRDGREAGLAKMRQGFPDVIDFDCPHPSCNGFVYFPSPKKFRTNSCVGCGRGYRLLDNFQSIEKINEPLLP